MQIPATSALMGAGSNQGEQKRQHDRRHQRNGHSAFMAEAPGVVCFSRLTLALFCSPPYGLRSAANRGYKGPHRPSGRI